MPKLSALSKSEKERIDKLKQRISIIPVSEETYILAKLGYFYGYECIKAYMIGELDHKSAQELLRAAEMVWNEYAYLSSLGTYYGTKDGKTFNKGSTIFKNRVKIQ